MGKDLKTVFQVADKWCHRPPPLLNHGCSSWTSMASLTPLFHLFPLLAVYYVGIFNILISGGEHKRLTCMLFCLLVAANIKKVSFKEGKQLDSNSK